MRDPMDRDYWLKKLSQSRYFTSDKDVELLRYLIQSTDEGKNLKETIIAIDFFGKDASFDPGSDSIVRSNIYNLRKKLESYYLDEGAQDTIKFIIPKGRYLVEIKKREQEKSKRPVISQTRLKIFLLFSTSLMLVFAFLFFHTNNKTGKEHKTEISSVWDYYLQSENPVLIVLGDYFMMQKLELPDSIRTFIRNPEINNQTDYFTYLDELSEQKNELKRLGQSYFGEEIPRCFLQIMRIFRSIEKPVGIKYSTELTLTDIQENDLIFVGDLSTLNLLNPFFEKTGFRYSINPQTMYVINEQNDTTESFFIDNPNQSVFQNDYATAASITSYPGKKILFLVSFLPFGKSEALHKLQESSFLIELTDSLPDFPSEWSLLMKISGLKSSGFYYEVVKFSH